MNGRIQSLLLCGLLSLGASCTTVTPKGDVPVSGVTLGHCELVGEFHGDTASFTLTATARVENQRGGRMELLSGPVALTEISANRDWHVSLEQGKYFITFDRAGEFEVEIKFDASLRQNNGWKKVTFEVAPSAPQPIVLRGLAEDTQFEFTGAAKPERGGTDYLSYLPANGKVELAWKEAPKAEEGKLFYAAETLSQISVSPGLMRQTVLLEGKVMQGELNQLVLRVRGEGEVTRVQGEQVLAWKVEPSPGSADRRLVVDFNQPQKDRFLIQAQLQTTLGAFPQSTAAVQLQPEDATRTAGHIRIVNEGAVRLEVLEAAGLSQVSPEQFPESDVTRAWFGATGSQRFVYRFSGADYRLRIQADNILPELGVSQVLAYHLGETETIIDAELELDIREAPVRELLLRVPTGYALARLNASGLSDYFLTDTPDGATAELRVVYGQPMSGRQVVQLRLERNESFEGEIWSLPRIEVVKSKSTRGHVGVSADAGFRLTPESTQGLTEIATAFFPKKLNGIQAGFRISDPGWQATLRIERLPQSIQADVFHLFSIGEGIAYGSSTMNFLISGAPISTFQVELSGEYYNVEFTGKDIRNWQPTTNGYVVHLHTPVSGTYTLLASYERPFKSQGDSLTFTGARPLDARTEQGHTIVVSDYQFQVNAEDVSTGLLKLEAAEVPPEYRLFFDAPILAAYRYTSRPFNLQLSLSPLAQGETLSLVVDRASLTTRISKEGQVLTDARYFVKNRGNPHLRLTLPEGVQLWSATVNGAAVVPVTDDRANLIPLPQRADPNSVLTLDFKLASRSTNPGRVKVSAPILSAPVLLAEWKVEPDAGQRLIYQEGTLTPASGVPDVSGFAGLARLFRGNRTGDAALLGGVALLLLIVAAWAWKWGSRGKRRLAARHLGGALLGLVAIAIVTICFLRLIEMVKQENEYLPANLTLLAPVQQAGSALEVTVANVEQSASGIVSSAGWFQVVLAAVIWMYALVTSRKWFKPVGWLLGWTLLAWAALRGQNGAALFLGLVWLYLILQVVLPGLWNLLRMPGSPEPGPAGHRSGAAAGAALIIAALLFGQGLNAGEAESEPVTEPPMGRSVTQEIRVEEGFAHATANIRWKAERGETLPVLFDTAVLTHIEFPEKSLRLVQATLDGKRAHQLRAQQSGQFDIVLQYQVPVTQHDGDRTFPLPVHQGLINKLHLTAIDLDVNVFAPNAVSIERESQGSNTVATLILQPASDASITLKPRSRDVRREKAVFFAELHQLYVPAAGVVDGLHEALIRPAQGELTELTFDVPEGATITDVELELSDGGVANSKSEIRNPKSAVWRFDPDTRILRVNLSPPQSKPFVVRIKSQVATGPLPIEQAVGLLKVGGASSQIGLLGVATGNEVQLDDVAAQSMTGINLDDFPARPVQALQSQVAGLTLRRAFRYNSNAGNAPAGTRSAVLKASPVDPDVRVNTQETLSLGEDRAVLAVNTTVEISRAGIFRLSFILPAGLDVESVTGNALSHWTELKSGSDRIITLHLKGRTLGREQFNLGLSGAGVKDFNGWTVPRFEFREATKQQGQLVIVPEQGMRLQVAAREGVTQLDPQKSGIRQKGVLAFRLLQSDWNLALDIEQVDAWVQVTSLQHFNVSEALVKVSASLQYQIENTGLKAFRVFLPTNAESVRFTGEQVSDFLKAEGAVTNSLQAWEVKLHRRVIGKYVLQAGYQLRIPEQAARTSLAGVRAGDVNLQRGFVTVQSGGRLQARVDAPPEALQPTEWQSIPRALRQDLSATTANYTFRLVDPSYELPVQLVRHEAAHLLPARVRSIQLNSVISDEGVMLTQVRMDMLPGDKRLLHLQLPARARFWFSFVNQNGVWPWREKDEILIPLEKQSPRAESVPVEFFYSSEIGKPGARALNLELLGPQFDLPLEDITWQVYLNEKWRLEDWKGTLQLQEQGGVVSPVAVDEKDYLSNEATLQREKTRVAEQWLEQGNALLQKGDPQQARRAFENAYGLSQHDLAFNEDARVQLHNLKVQQALVGLNVRQAGVAGEETAAAGRLNELRERERLNYTQQEAQQIFDANAAEDNAAMMRLAERIIQQQDAAVAAPTAIRASIPEQGRLLTFRRAVQVDPMTEMRIGLKAAAAKAAPAGTRGLILFATLVVLVLIGWLAKVFRGGAPLPLHGRG